MDNTTEIHDLSWVKINFCCVRLLYLIRQLKHVNSPCARYSECDSIKTVFSWLIKLMVQQARRKQNCIGPAYQYLWPSAYISVYAEAMEV